MRPQTVGAAEATTHCQGCGMRFSLSGLEREVQGHLQEPRAADGVLDPAKLAERRIAHIPIGSDARLALRKWHKAFCRIIVIRRRIGEERVKCNVIVRRIKTGVVENVKRLDIKLKFEALGDLEVLEKPHIHARLEGPNEDIAACGGETCFVDVTNSTRIAWRHSTLPRLQDRNAKS